MKKMLTSLLGTFAAVVLQFAIVQTAQAQGNQNDNFLMRLTIDGNVSDLKKGVDCGVTYAQFGASVTQEICGDVVWAYDETPDSLCCDTIITQDLTGKFAMIRRGTCNFSLKAYYAQEAGAIAVIIVNHYNTAADGSCTLVPMGAGTNAALVTIPVVGISRQTGEEIDAALQANETVNACLLLPRIYSPAVPYHYATPVSQVSELANMGVNYVNRDASEQTGIELKIDITEPGGNVSSITTTIDALASGVDTFVTFPPYTPPAVVGEFNVVISNNKYTEPRDSLTGKFIHTDYTFAVDNFVNDPGGVGTTNANFISGGFIHQEGNLCITGANGGAATHVTFGISNIDSVYVPNAPPGSAANDITLFVYDGDVDGDDAADFGNPGSFDDLTQVGYGVYTMTGNEEDGVFIDAAVGDLITGQPIQLQPNHIYYVSLLYNGLEAGYGRDIRFANTIEPWTYLNFPTGPLAIGNGTTLTLFSGWSGLSVVNRLQLEGFGTSTNDVLAETQVTLSPNPATDVVRVNVKLDAPSEMVTLTLYDARGQLVKMQTADNILEGQISMNVQDVPSGMYLMGVRTAEGSAMRKVAICH